MFGQPSWKRRLRPTLVPALVFVVVALMLTIVTRQLLTLQDESRHTQDVKDTLASITALMQEGENGMRGFLLTGDDGFLKPYNTASHEIGPALDRLQNLIDDNPVQRDNVARLRPVVLERMSQLTRAVGYYQPGRTLPVPIGSGPETHTRARYYRRHDGGGRSHPWRTPAQRWAHSDLFAASGVRHPVHRHDGRDLCAVPVAKAT